MANYYTETHEWIHIEGSVATIGISRFALEQLGDLVYIDLPESGRTVSKGEEVAVIESVKAASDVYAGLSGTITAVNQELADDPTQASADNAASCWLFRMEFSDPKELDSLMDEKSYLDSLEH